MKQPKPPIHVESAAALVAECDAIVRIAENLKAQGYEEFTVTIAYEILDNLKVILAIGGYAVELPPPAAGCADAGANRTISVTWKTGPTKS